LSCADVHADTVETIAKRTLPTDRGRRSRVMFHGAVTARPETAHERSVPALARITLPQTPMSRSPNSNRPDRAFHKPTTIVRIGPRPGWVAQGSQELPSAEPISRPDSAVTRAFRDGGSPRKGVMADGLLAFARERLRASPAARSRGRLQRSRRPVVAGAAPCCMRPSPSAVRPSRARRCVAAEHDGQSIHGFPAPRRARAHVGRDAAAHKKKTHRIGARGGRAVLCGASEENATSVPSSRGVNSRALGSCSRLSGMQNRKASAPVLFRIEDGRRAPARWSRLVGGVPDPFLTVLPGAPDSLEPGPSVALTLRQSSWPKRELRPARLRLSLVSTGRPRTSAQAHLGREPCRYYTEPKRQRCPPATDGGTSRMKRDVPASMIMLGRGLASFAHCR
jgi:hypothetical protein